MPRSPEGSDQKLRLTKQQRIVIGYLAIGATTNIVAVLGQVLGWW